MNHLARKQVVAATFKNARYEKYTLAPASLSARCARTVRVRTGSASGEPGSRLGEPRKKLGGPSSELGASSKKLGGPSKKLGKPSSTTRRAGK
jgi:hypothetical protein